MSNPISVGVFIHPSGAQFLDVATVDILGSISKAYFAGNPAVPAHLRAVAPEVAISYVTTSSMGRDISLKTSTSIRPTRFCADEEVSPGMLDIVIVPGPDPRVQFEEEGLKWLKRHWETPGTDVLSVCTGLYICAAAGVAEGKVASVPRGAQRDLKEKFSGVKVVGDKQRWVRDGNFWSSGVVTNEMILWRLTSRDLEVGRNWWWR